MQTKNAINKVNKKGYKITEEKGLYTFIIDGRNYSFRDQDGTAILFSTHFEGAAHPEFFSNLTVLIRFAENTVSNYGQVKQEEVEVVEPVVEEIKEIAEVIENSVLENTDSYKLVREIDGHKFYAKAFNSKEEAEFNSKYDYQSQIFENGKWFNHSNYGYSEDYSTHPEVIEETEESNAIVMPANKSSFKKTIIRPYVSPDIECVELILCDDGTPDYLLEVTKHLGHSIDFKVYSVTSCDPNSGIAVEFSLYLKGSVQWDGGSHFWFGEEDTATGRANGYLSLGSLEQYEKHFNLMRNIYLYASEMLGENEYFA